MDNKGLDGSMDTGLDDPSKTAIYSSQQYHNYPQNGHINNAQNNNGRLGAVRKRLMEIERKKYMNCSNYMSL